MKPSEIREKSDVEIDKLERELKEELFALKLKVKTGQAEKTHRLNEIKRDIARVLTIKTEKIA